jgi:uncharacterized protein (TIGR03067 family)
MTRRTRLILAVGILLVAGASPPDTSNRDHRALQGRWRVVTVRQEAINEPAAVDGFAWIFAGDNVTIASDGKPISKGTFRLRPTTSPKEIDLRFHAAKGEQERTRLAIYRLEENRLTICTYKDGKVRPRRFPEPFDFSPDKMVFRRGDYDPNRTAEEKAADELVADLERGGCRVDLDERRPGKPVIAIAAENSLFDDDCLEAVKRLSGLRALYLQSTPITDAGLVHLQALKKLQTLSLDFTEITDAGLAKLGSLTSLETLSLENTIGITDAALPQLRSMTHLREVNLDGTKITVEGIQALRNARPKLKIVAWP